MKLTEGAKISNQLVNAALNNPEFTFGFEAEFFYKGIDEFITKYMTKGSELDENEDWHVKPLGETRWHDVVMFFYPMAVDSETQQSNHTVMENRLFSEWEHITEYDADDHDGHWPTSSEMFAQLRSEMKMPAVMALLQIYPQHGMVLSEPQERSVKAIIQRGDVEKASTLGKLENFKYRMYEDGWEHQTFHIKNDASGVREIFYEIFAFQLQRYLGEPVQFTTKDAEDEGRYASGEYTTWVVLPDGSLSNVERYSPDLIGIEIISPVMPLGPGLHDMQNILAIIDNPGLLGFDTLTGVTTMDTGFHINLGIGGKKIDYLKLIMLMGDQHVLDEFGRSFYEQAEPMLLTIRDEIDQNPAKAIPMINQLMAKTGVTPNDMNNVIEMLTKMVPVDKFKSVNLKKLEQGYIEFRAAGGSNYQDDGAKMRKTVLSLAVWMYVATEPEIYKKEYFQSLVKFIRSIETGAGAGMSQDFPDKLAAEREMLRRGEEEQPISDSVGDGTSRGVGPTGRRMMEPTSYMKSMWVPEPENVDGYHPGGSEDDLP
jgi:hypothetical protein